MTDGKLEAENKALKRYITRGGFIKDRNGKWCKEGDKVSATYHYEGSEIIGEKPVQEEKAGTLCWQGYGLALHHQDGDGYAFSDIGISNIDTIELVEPCEPDVCKDFNILEE